jgi:hypothetical protein
VNRYYHETSATTILSKEGREIIDSELDKIKPVCNICNTELVRISMIEGDSIICPVDMYKHPTFWRVEYDIRRINPPKLKNSKTEETEIETSRKKLKNV